MLDCHFNIYMLFTYFIFVKTFASKQYRMVIFSQVYSKRTRRTGSLAHVSPEFISRILSAPCAKLKSARLKTPRASWTVSLFCRPLPVSGVEVVSTGVIIAARLNFTADGEGLTSTTRRDRNKIFIFFASGAPVPL